MVEWLFLMVPWGCLKFVIVVFPDHIHLLFNSSNHQQHLGRRFDTSLCTIAPVALAAVHSKAVVLLLLIRY